MNTGRFQLFHKGVCSVFPCVLTVDIKPKGETVALLRTGDRFKFRQRRVTLVDEIVKEKLIGTLLIRIGNGTHPFIGFWAGIQKEYGQDGCRQENRKDPF